LEKDATGVCTISKLFPHNSTKSRRDVLYTRRTVRFPSYGYYG